MKKNIPLFSLRLSSLNHTNFNKNKTTSMLKLGSTHTPHTQQRKILTKITGEF